jgi:four helix bundle protein
MLIQERSFNFGVKIFTLNRKLRALKEYDLASQVFRSGTSIGANVCEAEAGQSKRDFAAKMSISSKEAREILYWIRLMKASGYYDFDLDEYEKDAQDLVNILTKIVKTTQENIANEKKNK